ncbi:Phosphatidylinositol mannoside acyltransferase [Corynebacterium capitovis DSM 44611]|uniref:phosphatidylinositol mannoside acyltransferase n=1 Tax=Corynebacterium capitovis TaxID=131081 RepID=UPI000373729D|nr:phosphatidylinositol mannoside acyltransferase [Corynebacterium capitovis]WKD57552.1 Phosphatidylinositol mannoside acyltransferase [Corynebacterium capitovis DSM 44611]
MTTRNERLDPATLAYLAGWKTVGVMPERLAKATFDLGADVASDSGRGMEMLRRNLTRVVGPENVTRDLIRRATRSYARYWREAFRLPRIAGDERYVAALDKAVEGREYIDQARAAGRGVVIALPHSGNWDMAGMWLVSAYGQFTTVAERLKPEILYEKFVQYRSSLGFEVLPHAGAGGPYTRLEEVLHGNGIVCLMGERDLTPRGVRVTFFGEPASLPAGPAKLAAETGAALLPAHSWFAGEGWGLKAEAPIEVGDVVDTTQRLADRFAANIAAHPEDWHMLQPVWQADRDWARAGR